MLNLGQYAYKCREAEVSGIALAEALVPQVDTRLTMRTDTDEVSGYFREGFAFSPMYTIGIKEAIKGNAKKPQSSSLLPSSLIRLTRASHRCQRSFCHAHITCR